MYVQKLKFNKAISWFLKKKSKLTDLDKTNENTYTRN